MNKLKELTGYEFGRLTVIGISRRLPIEGKMGRQTKIYWECRCSCGQMTETRADKLLQGVTQSCGCYKAEGGPHNNRLPEGEAARRQLYKAYKRDADERELPFNLTMGKFNRLIGSNCHYCTQEPDIVSKYRWNREALYYNALDRKDEVKGYTDTNCVPICKMCKKIKALFPDGGLLTWAYRVYKKNYHAKA